MSVNYSVAIYTGKDDTLNCKAQDALFEMGYKWFSGHTRRIINDGDCLVLEFDTKQFGFGNKEYLTERYPDLPILDISQ